MKSEVLDFLSKRPKVVACYGYGSGVFKQTGYTKKDKPQIDLIIVVDDLKKWHLENIKLNPKDYSLIGKNFFKKKGIDKIKGDTGIVYVSNIKYNGNIYKYGTIEEKDLINYLNSWDSFYLPGRFQKNLLPIVGKNVIDKANRNNRDNALRVALLTLEKDNINLVDIYTQICSLSYFGDTRMKFAENPHKVFNIVTGSFDFFKETYGNSSIYYKMNKKGIITIDYDKLLSDIKLLPSSLNIESTNIEEIRNSIYNYLIPLNKKESTNQTLKGLKSNGITKSIKYALKKIAKRRKK